MVWNGTLDATGSVAISGKTTAEMTEEEVDPVKVKSPILPRNSRQWKHTLYDHMHSQ